MMREYHFVNIEGPGSWTFYAKCVKHKSGSSTKRKLEGFGEERMKLFLGQVVDSSLVVDQRPASGRPDFAKNVLRGPMVNVDLPPLLVDASNEVDEEVIAACGKDVQDMYAIVKAMSEGQAIGAFDYVSPEIYAEFWKEQGARVGRVINGSIVWE